MSSGYAAGDAASVGHEHVPQPVQQEFEQRGSDGLPPIRSQQPGLRRSSDGLVHLGGTHAERGSQGGIGLVGVAMQGELEDDQQILGFEHHLPSLFAIPESCKGGRRAEPIPGESQAGYF